MFIELITNGLITGTTLAVITLGFALVYNTTKIFHIAYSVIYMTAPYFYYYLTAELKISVPAAMGLAILITGLISIIVEIYIYTPLTLKKTSSGVIIISSLGVMIVGIHMIAMVFGNDLLQLHRDPTYQIPVFGLLLTKIRIFQLLAGSTTVLFLLAILKFTNLGTLIRAMRDNDTLLGVFGTNITKLKIIIFGISGILAGIGSLLVTYDIGIDPHIGMPMLINCIVALIIGGVGRFKFCVIGALFIGFLHAFTEGYLSYHWKDGITFLILVIFLLFRPQGIGGERLRTF